MEKLQTIDSGRVRQVQMLNKANAALNEETHSLQAEIGLLKSGKFLEIKTCKLIDVFAELAPCLLINMSVNFLHMIIVILTATVVDMLNK